MFKKPEKLVGHEEAKWLKDLTPNPEKVGFDATQMLDCDVCKRKNPPTRTHCFYCGAKLAIPAGKEKFVRPHLRLLEDWEKGINVICYNAKSAGEKRREIAELAYILRLEPEIAEKILSSETPLPIARVASLPEAETVVQRLAERGFDSLIVFDEELNLEKPPLRLRTIEFGAAEFYFVLLNGDEVLRVDFDSITLLVTGVIIETKTETAETSKKAQDKKTPETIETSSDEFVLDIYTKNHENGFRISSRGFDFSGLEEEKTLLAAENFRLLLAKIRRLAPNARIDENYRRIKYALNAVWHLEEKNDRRGLRSGLVKTKIENIVIKSNAAQFTKYSRLSAKIKIEDES